MPIIALAAALGASLCWAVGSLIAHRPATQLGAFEFTRTQLISSFALLIVIVTVLNGWQSVTWVHWPSFAAASLIGVLFTNLAMIACLRRGGPRRMQLLVSMSAPFAAICKAVGLIALKPALLAGTDPLAATALRTGGGALVISVVALWPAEAFETPTKRTPSVVFGAILPGFVGYIAAVSLQLYALRTYDAGIVATLSSMAPVVMLPMIWIMSGDPPPLPAWFGAILAVLGAGIIFAG